jgi:hypothetical protein
MTVKVICTGYREGEVIPSDREILPEQKRILDYLEGNSDAIKIGDSYELRRILELEKLADEVEILGSIYNLCVANATQIALRKGARKVKIDPAKTISLLRLGIPEIFSEKEDLERRITWFKENFPQEGIKVEEENGFLYFS